MNVSNRPEFALITGASKGIGRAIAETCAKRRINVILIARSEDKLRELAQDLKDTYQVEAYYFAEDLSKPESAKRIYEWCVENGYLVYMLVNNAGMGLFGKFRELELGKQMDLIQLNINSLVQLVYYFLPMLESRQKGYILNVASIAALYPLPYYSVYGASKAFVLSFTEALRFELREKPITVSCLCPGDTETEFFNQAGNHKKRNKLMPPSIVADTAMNELLKDKEVIYPGKIKWIAKLPRKVLKKAVSVRLARYMK